MSREQIKLEESLAIAVKQLVVLGMTREEIDRYVDLVFDEIPDEQPTKSKAETL